MSVINLKGAGSLPPSSYASVRGQPTRLYLRKLHMVMSWVVRYDAYDMCRPLCGMCILHWADASVLAAQVRCCIIRMQSPV